MKPNFRIKPREPITDEIREEIKNAYKNSKKPKTVIYREFSEKYGVSQRQYYETIKEIPDRKQYRHTYVKRYNTSDVIDEAGGIKLIAALKREGWRVDDIMAYFNVSHSTFQRFMHRHNVFFKQLPSKEGLDEVEVERVKEMYDI